MEETMVQGRSLHQQRERRASCEMRVSELRQQVERRRQHVQELHERLRDARATHDSQAARLQQHRKHLASTEEEHRAAAASLPTVYGGLRTLMQQLRCRQIRMLHEVCQ